MTMVIIFQQGWTAVGQRNQAIDFQLQSTPLQIHTNSEIGSGDLIWAQFYDSDDTSRGLTVSFVSPPNYDMGYCKGDTEIPLSKLGTNKNRIWTIEKENTKIKVACNGILIFEYDPQLSSDQECREKWAQDTSSLKFGSTSSETDTASDFYRAYTTGNDMTRLRP